MASASMFVDKGKATDMLNGDEVGADKRDVVDLPEHANHSAVVDARNQNGKKVSEESGLLLEIEGESLVVTVTSHQLQHESIENVQHTSRRWPHEQQPP